MDGQPSNGSGSGWLLPAAFALVLLGTISYALGRVVDAIAFDYVSIACSAAAAFTLVAAVRASKRPRHADA
jgi:hypothetical protein